MSGLRIPKGGGKQIAQCVAGPPDLPVMQRLVRHKPRYCIDRENVYTLKRRPHIERSICAL